MHRTKIVCTIGPATSDPGILRRLIRAGMNVARINYSHGEAEEHRRTIELIRQTADEEQRVVAVLADLQGPKLRVGDLPDSGLVLVAGQVVWLSCDPATPGDIPLPHPELIYDMQPGDRILLDDGLLELQVEQAAGGRASARVVTGGLLTSHKGVSMVGGRLLMPAVTDKDRHDLADALGCGVDYVAQSFVRRAADVRELRDAMQRAGASVPIIAKIEKAEGLQHFDEILAEADGVMVARGDLGVETSLAEVPIHQKAIIRACNTAAKPVITATQMLESMTHNPRPTRAEASDVANAILDGTDAVMLSGETAVGRYPIETVETMIRIAEAAEAAFPYDLWRLEAFRGRADSVTDSISQACCEIADELGAAAIVSATMSGTTARAVAHNRPRTPILALTPNAATCRRLALVWGVRPQLIQEYAGTDDMVRLVREQASQQGFGKPGDLLVITAGAPVGAPGRTNMIQVHVVG